jgi:hypothetical protein
MKIQLKLWHVLALILVFAPLSVWGANTMWSALGTLTGATLASGDRFTLLDISDTTHGAGGTAKTITAQELKDGYVNTAPLYAAGSASANTWPKYTAGTLLTTPEDGGFEQDADTFYLTTDAGNRGYVPAKNCIRADATRTFTSNTTEQAIFTTPANGRITLETGLYAVSGTINIGSMSASSGNGAFDLIGAGSATLGAILYHIVGVDGAVNTAGTQTGSTNTAAQTPASAVTAGTGTAMTMRLGGSFEVTGAGTLQPSFTMVTAAASVVAIGSYICFERIGSTSMTSVGQWD